MLLRTTVTYCNKKSLQNESFTNRNAELHSVQRIEARENSSSQTSYSLKRCVMRFLQCQKDNNAIEMGSLANVEFLPNTFVFACLSPFTVRLLRGISPLIK